MTRLKTLEDLKETLEKSLKKDLISLECAHQELSITILPSVLIRILTHLRDHKDLLFVQLMDVCGVDWLGEDPRFQVVYHLLSLHHNHRIRVKVNVAENQAIPTVTPLFHSAGWWEREVWDLYGIPFDGHPDLRRILTDHGFEGHPLRKDFPLTGFLEMRYDEAQKRTLYEPVQLMQAFRNFDFLSPWEGTLPGDEKAGEGPP